MGVNTDRIVYNIHGEERLASRDAWAWKRWLWTDGRMDTQNHKPLLWILCACSYSCNTFALPRHIPRFFQKEGHKLSFYVSNKGAMPFLVNTMTLMHH